MGHERQLREGEGKDPERRGQSGIVWGEGKQEMGRERVGEALPCNGVGGMAEATKLPARAA